MAQGTYNAFKTDTKLETNGIILDMGQAGKFQVARAGGANKRFAKSFQKETKPFRRAIQTEQLEDEVASKLLVNVYVETVLAGWEGVTDETGATLEYNKANATKLLNDLPWLFEEIRRGAEDAALFKLVTMEQDAKN